MVGDNAGCLFGCPRGRRIGSAIVEADVAGVENPRFVGFADPWAGPRQGGVRFDQTSVEEVAYNDTTPVDLVTLRSSLAAASVLGELGLVVSVDIHEPAALSVLVDGDPNTVIGRPFSAR